jgi:hypothetical protein
MLFVFLLNANLEESNECWSISISFRWHVIDGMGGVMTDKHLEARVMGHQVNVENLVPLVISGIIEEEEMQASEDVGETFNGDDDQVEMDLERTILMIED